MAFITNFIASLRPSFVNQEERAEDILIASTDKADSIKLKDYIPSKCTEIAGNWNSNFAKLSLARKKGYLEHGYNQIGCDSKRVGLYSGSMDTGLLFVQERYLRDKSRLQSYIEEAAENE